MSLEGGVSDRSAPQGQDRQTEPHRVNVMVTAAGVSLACSHCSVLVDMPDLWLRRQRLFGETEAVWCGANVVRR